MKSIYMACAGALLLGSSLAAPATAADLTDDYAPAFAWDGLYAGVHGGYLWGDADAEHDTVSGNFGKNYDPSGGFLGAHAGYLHQFDSNLVLGLEADFDKLWADGGLDQTDTPEFNPFPDADGEAKLKWQSSFRARVGYAFDRTMPYLTGGISFARLHYSEEIIPEAPMFDQDDKRTMFGWTVGGGVAHAFTDNWIGHIEYRYTDYGSENFLPTPVANQPGDSSKIDLETHAVRVGISYLLGN